MRTQGHLSDLVKYSKSSQEAPARIAEYEGNLAKNKHEADSVLALTSTLRAKRDTSRVGLLVPHSFRAKNKMGALSLESATFLVRNNGAVEIYR